MNYLLNLATMQVLTAAAAPAHALTLTLPAPPDGTEYPAMFLHRQLLQAWADEVWPAYLAQVDPTAGPLEPELKDALLQALGPAADTLAAEQKEYVQAKFPREQRTHSVERVQLNLETGEEVGNEIK